MKKSILIAVFVTIIATSCSKFDVIWDIYPVIATIRVYDTDGKDLLDLEKEWALDTAKIKAIYRGNEYSCNGNKYDYLQTKAYLPRFYGLRFSSNPNRLHFGELEGAESYNNEEIIIIWGDGTQDKISFNREFKWRVGRDPKVKQQWFLNDVKVEGDIINIVKSKSTNN